MIQSLLEANNISFERLTKLSVRNNFSYKCKKKQQKFRNETIKILKLKDLEE